MELKICLACKKKFRKLSQIPNQTYCSDKKCQNERRRLSQKSRRSTDPDYKENQTRANQAWMKRNPDYSRKYRKLNPAAAERNRALQRGRNAKRKLLNIAKMEASPKNSTIPPGIYRLTPLSTDGIAKMDEWIVQITLISKASD